MRKGVRRALLILGVVVAIAGAVVGVLAGTGKLNLSGGASREICLVGGYATTSFGDSNSAAGEIAVVPPSETARVLLEADPFFTTVLTDPDVYIVTPASADANLADVYAVFERVLKDDPVWQPGKDEVMVLFEIVLSEAQEGKIIGVSRSPIGSYTNSETAAFRDPDQPDRYSAGLEFDSYLAFPNTFFASGTCDIQEAAARLKIKAAR